MSVGAIIRQLCSPCRQTVHRTRGVAVETVAEGIARAGTVSPSHVGRVLRSRALPKHSIKRVDRLLSNAHLHGEWAHYYAALAQWVLRAVERPVVLVEWSGAVKGMHTLSAAVPIGGRAVTVYAEVHPASKYANRDVQTKFLQTLRGVLGPERRPVIVVDAGFSAPFMNGVRALGWDFVSRVRGRVCMRKGPQGPWLQCKDVYPRAQRAAKDLGHHRFTRDRSSHRTEPSSPCSSLSILNRPTLPSIEQPDIPPVLNPATSTKRSS